MKKFLVAAALGVPLMASAQLVNGGFGTGTFAGWTTVFVGATEPTTVLTYGVGAAFGETVVAPVGGGTFGAYFIEDVAPQSISQIFAPSAGAGLYNWGFQYYLPFNGFANPNDTAFSVMLGGSSIFAGTLSALGAPGVWHSVSGTAALLGVPTTFSVTFDGTTKPAKDLIFDNAFVTVVPEPENYALMLAGLAAVTFVARRRSKT